LTLQDKERPSKIRQQFRELIETALVDAALREMAPLDGSKAKEPEPLDLGYLFHNCGFENDSVTNKRLSPIISGLQDFDCWMKLNTTGNVFTEHGDTGAARSVLMLAKAAICAALVQLPVMITEWGEEGRVSIGLVRPAA
jgi:hypothetical protein